MLLLIGILNLPYISKIFSSKKIIKIGYIGFLRIKRNGTSGTLSQVLYKIISLK